MQLAEIYNGLHIFVEDREATKKDEPAIKQIQSNEPELPSTTLKPLTFD